MNLQSASSDHEGIAVIGMSGRFPGARDLEIFWRNLRDGVESIAFFSDDQLRKVGVDPSVRNDPRYVGAGGVLEDIDLFDAAFFGFNPREAEAMDPQHRFFLECAWEAFENAGYDPARCEGPVGVYAGTGISTYFFNLYENPELMELLGGHQVMIGNDKDHLTTHVSYKLNLRGPSLTVQTACSTSLVAVCVACQSLADYQCDMAIAGGSSIAIPQSRGYMYREGGIASPDGHCRAFDAAARGTVVGNGIGVVLLKRLADALADRDAIRAVIRGWAINNDGSVKVGYTAPSVQGQAEVITMAQALANVTPESITYVEAHGTGTPLGDPIEVAALAQVFAPVRERARCALGSVKSNIGHLDTAAGIAGLVKTLLAIENACIPPSLHFAAPNPKLELDRTPFYVPTRAQSWDGRGNPLRAGVSSFGIGGTNAHVVVEEAPRPVVSDRAPDVSLLILSAPTLTGLAALRSRHAEFLRTHHEANLGDVAYTLAIGRKAFRHRRAVVCRGHDDAAAVLEASPSGAFASSSGDARRRSVAFMFPGQGVQYPGMTAGLYADVPVFREHVDACLETLRVSWGLDLRPHLYPASGHPGEHTWHLTETDLAQPALFITEYALAQTLLAWGVAPRCMIGHSVGEYVAACIAGVFTLEDALQLVVLRGRLMQAMAPGAMIAVSLPESDVAGFLGAEVALAAVNGSSQCVLSGSTDAIERAAAALERRGAPCVRLRTSHAFHSHMMEPMLPSFKRALRQVDCGPPSIPIVSNLTGDWATDGQMTDAKYWVEHVRNTVRFAQGLDRLCSDDRDMLLLEVGPGQALSTLARRRGNAPSVLSLSCMQTAAEPGDEWRHLLGTVGRLWSEGVDVDWDAFYARQRRGRVPLPTYPFERKRFWIDAKQRVTAARASADRRIDDVSRWLYRPSWQKLDGPHADDSPLAKQWLVFTEGALGRALARRLVERGADVSVVDAADRLERLSDREYRIDPANGADYRSVLAGLREQGRNPDRIVHCWGMREAAGDDVERAQQLGFHSMLHLTRALAAERAGEASITVVTQGLASVHASDPLEPAKAMVLGACKVIPQEYPGLRCRVLDVARADSEVQADRIIDECSAPVHDTVIAYRGDDRWVQCFVPARWAEPSPRSSTLPRERGVYLITGGFGGIGLTFAESLARHHRARLALVGRTELPSRGQWNAWLAVHGPADVVSQRIGAVRELEQLGAEVLVLSADVSQRAQMIRAIEAVRERFGDLNGVIHAAGATRAEAFAPIAATGESIMNEHAGPKVAGTLILRDLLDGKPVDFCMLVSSLSSILGGLNFSAYAAANNFMDAFAAQQNRVRGSTLWITVNWDGWRWQEDGGAERAFYLRPAEGAIVFRGVLARRCPHLVVSTGDLDARIERWIKLPDVAPAGGHEAVSPIAPSHGRPELETAFASPRNAVEQMIADLWQIVLGVDSVGIHDNFFELGGHSLLAIQLVSRLKDMFQAEIGLPALFEHQTVAAFAAYVQSIVADAESQMQELAKMLDYVERLTPDEVTALLAARDESAVVPSGSREL